MSDETKAPVAPAMARTVELRQLAYDAHWTQIMLEWWYSHDTAPSPVELDYLHQHAPEMMWRSGDHMCKPVSEMDLAHVFYTIRYIVRTFPTKKHPGLVRFRKWWLGWLTAEVERRRVAASEFDPLSAEWKALLRFPQDRHMPRVPGGIQAFLHDPVSVAKTSAKRSSRCSSCDNDDTVVDGVCRFCTKRRKASYKETDSRWKWSGDPVTASVCHKCPHMRNPDKRCPLVVECEDCDGLGVVSKVQENHGTHKIDVVREEDCWTCGSRGRYNPWVPRHRGIEKGRYLAGVWEHDDS